SGTGAQADRNRRRQGKNPQSAIHNPQYQSDRLHWTGRRRQDDVDRRIGAALPQQRQEITGRDFVTRPERHWRGRVAGRSRDDDQFTKRSRVHPQHGDPRTSRRTFARDEGLPRTAGAVGIRLRHHRNGRHWPGSNAVSKKWARRSNGAGDEPRLRQPIATAENRNARSRRHRGREQKRFTAGEDGAHRDRTASRTESAQATVDRHCRETSSRRWRGPLVRFNFRKRQRREGTEEKMSKLGNVVESVEKYNQFVVDQVKRARTDKDFSRDLVGRWNDIKAKIPTSRTPTGIPLPRLALPEIDEAGEIARYLFGEGLP